MPEVPDALPPDAQAWVNVLGLAPLEHEGGLFAQGHRDAHSTAITYLLAGTDFSAMHVLDAVEVYHWYAGDPVELLLLHPDGRVETPRLGTNHRAGERPQIVVPAGVMQGSSSAGSWSLLGTTMAPPFTWDGFRLGERSALQLAYPTAAARIAALTRD